MRSMVLNGDLGDLRVVFAEFAGGFMADSSDSDNPRVKWSFTYYMLEWLQLQLIVEYMHNSKPVLLQIKR